MLGLNYYNINAFQYFHKIHDVERIQYFIEYYRANNQNYEDIVIAHNTPAQPSSLSPISSIPL